MVKVAVNGFGRIGRLEFYYAWDDPSLEIVHVNDLCSVESAAYLLKYDSVHGTWDKEGRTSTEKKQKCHLGGYEKILCSGGFEKNYSG